MAIRLVRWTIRGLTLGLLVAGLAACSSGARTPRLAAVLPDKCNTPDGMTLDSQNNIILSVPSLNDRSATPCLMKLTPDGKLESFMEFPVEAGKPRIVPLGNAFASDGNLYLCDSQALGGDENYRSRLLKITMQNGRPVDVKSVVEGFVFSNAAACHGDCVYVTETKFEPNPPAGPMPSGVYRFKLSELTGDKPIVLQRGGTDPHLVYKMHTQNSQWRVGANGLGFAADGTMYVCNFGDQQLMEVKLDADGKLLSQRLAAGNGPMLSCDGLKVDQRTGLVYIADFLASAVHEVDPRTGRVTMLARSLPGDGKAGQLKKCSEVCLRDGKIYVANINLPLDGNVPGDTYTISVIDLKGGSGSSSGSVMNVGGM